MRLLIADDHALFRDSLRSLLEVHGHEVVAEAEDGEEAVRRAVAEAPDVALMDLAMPGMGGLEATRRIVAEQPATKVVVLTASTDDEDLFEALKAGAVGYVMKNLQGETFLGLLEDAAAGHPALTPELSRKVLQAFAAHDRRGTAAWRDPDALTERELEVLTLMTDGVTSNRQLARRLEVSENTVKFHVRNILDKLHLHNRAQAVSHALRHKLVDPGEG